VIIVEHKEIIFKRKFVNLQKEKVWRKASILGSLAVFVI
jgi:hypothetical protein